ncbi:hypothetical protein H0H93_011840 [Arthromyces matolae]|nr:hypothetical protein H0H93_011840 [Arthromyces matolae]
MRPATPEPEKPFRAVIVRVADVGDHVEIQGARKLPKGATVIIREDPTFDLLTVRFCPSIYSTPMSYFDFCYRVKTEFVVLKMPDTESSAGSLSAFMFMPTQRSRSTVRTEAWCTTIYNQCGPMITIITNVRAKNGMIVMVKTDAFYNNKIEKVKASALFRITSETATSPGGLPVAAGSKLLPKACYQGYEVQLAEKEFTLANTRESKIRHNQLKKAPL